MVQSDSNNTGVLYIVATPIGNLSDMVPRAIDILQTVDAIAAEDTRHSGKLLQHFGISTPMFAYHDHNESGKVPKLIEELQQGRQFALISDAGTPLISDPGYKLVHHARLAGVRVVPIPGPCAFVTALSASGLPSDRFRFEGFLPAKQTQRLKALESLKSDSSTLIYYESSHRIEASLTDMAEAFGGERLAVVARELTKTYETFLSGTLSEVLARVQSDAHQQRGEFVVLVHGAEALTAKEDALDESSTKLLRLLLDEGLALKRAAALTAKYTGERKNRLYEWGLENS